MPDVEIAGDERAEGRRGDLTALRKAGAMPWWCTLRSRFLLARAGAVMGAVLVAATIT